MNVCVIVILSYVGGSEHSIMHLLFARFIARFLYKEKIVPSPEPFDYLITQGMVQAETFINTVTGAYELPSNVEKHGEEYRNKETGEMVEMKYIKMSKSKHNGVDPVDVIQQYGSDVVRIAMLMQCPPENAFHYNKSIMLPAKELLSTAEKVCSICIKKENPGGKKMNLVEISKANNKVIFDMKSFNFHNVVANINIMFNHLERSEYSPSFVQYTKNALLFLSPFAPIKTEALWNELIEGKCIPPQESFEKQTWPKEEKVFNIMSVVQVIVNC